MVDVIDVLSTLFMIIKYTDIQMPIPRSQLLIKISALTGPYNRTYRHLADSRRFTLAY